MKVAVFHPGIQHSWQTALALQQLGRLEWYATSIFYRADRWPFALERLLPGRAGAALKREFARFAFPPLDPRDVRTLGAGEWLERLAARAGLRRTARWFNDVGNAAFARSMARAARDPRPFALWGYDTAAAAAFRAGRDAGRLCVLDRTIGDWRRYNREMAAIQASHGEWFPAHGGFASADLIARDDEEFALAHTILTGSRFAAETIRAESPVPGLAGKLRVLPYCFDERLFSGLRPPAPAPRDKPVKFLFLGVAQPRKGIHHVLEAIARLPASQAELTIVGKLEVPDAVFRRYADRVTVRRTVPRGEVPQIMAAHHVLLFPSYFEGSALSLIEGLAAGMALIQTPNAGNGVTPATGIEISRPDTELLLEAMLALIEDRDRLDAYRAAAQAEAARYSFAAYRENIAALLAELES
ncbi:MAG: glycosyltransferase family 4 protein [Novosphingobium sp.]